MDEINELADLADELFGNRPKEKKPRKSSIFDNFICSNCGKIDPIMIDDVYIVCPKCGETLIDEAYVPSYVQKNEFYNKRQCAYKRIAYFDTLLTRLRGRHCFKIDEETKEAIKEKMGKMKKTINNLKKVLKEMKMTKFYKCCYALLLMLFGNETRIEISITECEIMKDLFRTIQMPYEKYKTNTRCNFMSYAFILKKLFHHHHIGRDDLGCLIALPKNKFLIYKHELIWADISDELGWENDKWLF